MLKNIRFTGIYLAFFLAFACKSTQPVQPSAEPEPRVESENIPPSEKSEIEESSEEKGQVEMSVENMASNENKKPQNLPPLDIYEFRAAWVATVANINWPSKNNLSTAQQQQEAVRILDFLKAQNFNAVIFQARPQADAFYESELEPWSYFLTGEQGRAPQPYYDPLLFWINEAHKRGLELHVWLNPYRAHHTTGGEVTEKSIVKTLPGLSVKLANGMWWMDPSKEETQEHSAKVITDIVERYDVDGIHIDDYFYPYDSYNNGKDFPDELSWQSYMDSKGKLSKSDWRRDHVNRFIKRIYSDIKSRKPHVKFGISPFGIWRPGYPQSVNGLDQYDKLYADAKLWLNEGWLDYFSPQLYWKVNQPQQSFPELLGWWKGENTKDRHLWPGINVVLDENEKNVDEILNQIYISRGMLPESKGVVHWNVGPLMRQPSFARALAEGPYKKPTLVPASPWLGKGFPRTPEVKTTINGERLQVFWTSTDENIMHWVLYFKYENGSWDYKILEGAVNSYSLQYLVGDKKRKLTQLGITAVDRVGNQSDFEQIAIK